MTVEHPMWLEDIQISGAYIDESAPGVVEIKFRWAANVGPTIILHGNDADDFMERYRGAPDSEHKDLVLRQAIWVGVQP